MAKQHKIETIADILAVVNKDNVEVLKSDICDWLDHVISMQGLKSLGISNQSYFTWNDDGIKGLKAVHIEIKEKK